MLLGLDFDNTLICYDGLFHQVALEKKLIPALLPPKKQDVRNYLRCNDMEDEWTRMQGEVYGNRIMGALPYEGMFEALLRLKNTGLKMCLVSHKTRRPYIGQNYDLHQAARDWLIANFFYDKQGLNWNDNQIFFELTKEDKVKRIVSLGCTHYIDDLPEILEMIPDNITRILFAPDKNSEIKSEWLILKSWSDLPNLL